MGWLTDLRSKKSANEGSKLFPVPWLSAQLLPLIKEPIKDTISFLTSGTCEHCITLTKKCDFYLAV